MRLVISLIAALVAVWNRQYDISIAVVIVILSGTSFRRILRDFLCGMYERYTYARLNHTIKVALANKKELTQAHIDLIVSRKWKEVLAWITFHPDELLLVDRKKQTILHHSCLFRAPAVVIEMLLFQAPELVSMKNQDGEIPLNWAVRLSAPIEVLQLLLSVDPGLGCTSKDKEGNTALSLIWERHSDILLEMWWQEGKDKIVDFHWWKRILFLLQRYHRSVILKCAKNPFENQLDNFGDEAEKEDDSYPFLALHTVTRCQHCPVALFPLMLKVYQQQLSQKDGDGRLPLAVACLDAISNRSAGVLTKIQLLLLEFPLAAEYRDNQQRLPLFTALEAGICMDEGISELLTASPKSLSLFDPLTGLAPFLLAAVGARNRQHRISDCRIGAVSYPAENNSDEVRSLSTIYTLLRSEPSQLLLQRDHVCQAI